MECYALVAALSLGTAVWQTGTLEGHNSPFRVETPAVFQAAGPSAASIQSTVEQFRAAIGGNDNKNNTGPLTEGRREINWDGGGSSATSRGPTPFDVFLITRGARVTTPGSGFVQAPPSGLATTFNNASYATAFAPFSLLRLFSPIDSNVSRVTFFVPGGGELPATTTAFGVVFSDVDQQKGLGFDEGRRKKEEGRREKEKGTSFVLDPDQLEMGRASLLLEPWKAHGLPHGSTLPTTRRSTRIVTAPKRRASSTR